MNNQKEASYPDQIHDDKDECRDDSGSPELQSGSDREECEGPSDPEGVLFPVAKIEKHISIKLPPEKIIYLQSGESQSSKNGSPLRYVLIH